MSDRGPPAHRYRREKQTEPIRKCMYCGEKYVSRGTGPHVRNNVGNGHGEHGETPPDYDIEKCEIVGETTVSINNRVAGNDSDSLNELFICRICGTQSKGWRGFKIHLGKKKEFDDQHPDDSDDVTEEMYSIVPSDEDWKPLNDDAVRQALSSGFSINEDSITVPVVELQKIRSNLRDPDLSDGVAAEEITRLIQQYD